MDRKRASVAAAAADTRPVTTTTANKGSFAYTQESERFMKDLRQFHEGRGSNIPRWPCIGGSPLDMYALYTTVTQLGGWEKVSSAESWGDVQEQFRIPASCGNADHALRQIYIRYLNAYERLHHFGQDPDSRDDSNDMDDLPSSRKKVQGPVGGIALSYNYHQHNSSEAAREMLGLPKEPGKPSEYSNLERSLVSGLPNEIDFAVNVCLLLSNENRHTLRGVKGLHVVELLLSHVGICKESDIPVIWLICNSKLKYLKFWHESVDNWTVKELVCPEALLTYKVAEDRSKDDDGSFDLSSPLHLSRGFGMEDREAQRVTQLAMIIRNLSFEEDNVEPFSSSLLLFRFIMLCIYNKHGCIRQLALDTMANIAYKMALEPVDCGMTQLVLRTVSSCLLSCDRFNVVSALETLSRLCQLELNEDAICCQLDDDVYEHLVRLLTLHDLQLIVPALETIYQLSEIGTTTSNEIAKVRASVDILVAFLTIDPQTYGSNALPEANEMEQCTNLVSNAVHGQDMGPPSRLASVPPRPLLPSVPQVPVAPMMSQTFRSPKPPVPTSSVSVSPTSSTRITSSSSTTSVVDNEAAACNWLQAQYEYASDRSVTKMEMYRRYVSVFSMYGLQHIVNPTCFVNCIRVAFPNAKQEYVEKDGTSEIIYEGLCSKAKPTPFSLSTGEGQTMQTGSSNALEDSALIVRATATTTTLRGVVPIANHLAKNSQSTTFPAIQQVLTNSERKNVVAFSAADTSTSSQRMAATETNFVKSLLATKVTQNMNRLQQTMDMQFDATTTSDVTLQDVSSDSSSNVNIATAAGGIVLEPRDGGDDLTDDCSAKHSSDVQIMKNDCDDDVKMLSDTGQRGIAEGQRVIAEAKGHRKLLLPAPDGTSANVLSEHSYIQTGESTNIKRDESEIADGLINRGCGKFNDTSSNIADSGFGRLHESQKFYFTNKEAMLSSVLDANFNRAGFANNGGHLESNAVAERSTPIFTNGVCSPPPAQNSEKHLVKSERSSECARDVEAQQKTGQYETVVCNSVIDKSHEKLLTIQLNGTIKGVMNGDRFLFDQALPKRQRTDETDAKNFAICKKSSPSENFNGAEIVEETVMDDHRIVSCVRKNLDLTSNHVHGENKTSNVMTDLSDVGDSVLDDIFCSNEVEIFSERNETLGRTPVSFVDLLSGSNVDDDQSRMDDSEIVLFEDFTVAHEEILPSDVWSDQTDDRSQDGPTNCSEEYDDPSERRSVAASNETLNATVSPSVVTNAPNSSYVTSTSKPVPITIPPNIQAKLASLEKNALPSFPMNMNIHQTNMNIQKSMNIQANINIQTRIPLSQSSSADVPASHSSTGILFNQTQMLPLNDALQSHVINVAQPGIQRNHAQMSSSAPHQSTTGMQWVDGSTLVTGCPPMSAGGGHTVVPGSNQTTTAVVNQANVAQTSQTLSHMMIGGQSQPLSQMITSQSQALIQMIAGQSQNPSLMIANQSQPASHMIASQSQPLNQMIASQSQPASQVIVGQSQPLNQMIASQSQPASHVMAGHLQPLNQMITGQSHPLNQMIAGQSPSASQMIASQSQPLNQMIVSQSQQMIPPVYIGSSSGNQSYSQATRISFLPRTTQGQGSVVATAASSSSFPHQLRFVSTTTPQGHIIIQRTQLIQPQQQQQLQQQQQQQQQLQQQQQQQQQRPLHQPIIQRIIVSQAGGGLSQRQILIQPSQMMLQPSGHQMTNHPRPVFVHQMTQGPSGQMVMQSSNQMIPSTQQQQQQRHLVQTGYRLTPVIGQSGQLVGQPQDQGLCPRPLIVQQTSQQGGQVFVQSAGPVSGQQDMKADQATGGVSQGGVHGHQGQAGESQGHGQVLVQQGHVPIQYQGQFGQMIGPQGSPGGQMMRQAGQTIAQKAQFFLGQQGQILTQPGQFFCQTGATGGQQGPMSSGGQNAGPVIIQHGGGQIMLQSGSGGLQNCIMFQQGGVGGSGGGIGRFVEGTVNQAVGVGHPPRSGVSLASAAASYRMISVGTPLHPASVSTATGQQPSQQNSATTAPSATTTKKRKSCTTVSRSSKKRKKDGDDENATDVEIVTTSQTSQRPTPLLPHPPPPPSVQYTCEWMGCKRCFGSFKSIYQHVTKEHFEANKESAIACEWSGCDGLIKRQRWSFMTHLQDRHLNEASLKASAAALKHQLNTTGVVPTPLASSAPPPLPPLPSSVYPPNAALQAIRRFNARHPFPEMLDAKEDSVSKHIHLTSALILRNLARYSSLGRSLIKKHEKHLAFIAFSETESSSAISNCLWELQGH